MASTPPIVKRREHEENSTPADLEDASANRKLPFEPKVDGKPTSKCPKQQSSSKLALIPMRSVAFSKNAKQQQQQPLEAKQFPIVLGRANLSQWWYQSCDCQQYYCRLHCRPVAQNIGSLSKVMIQIDTKGTAHIVGKNPHLVTIITPERGNNNNYNKSSSNDAKCAAGTDQECNDNSQSNKDDHHQPIALRPNDILSIGRRDREPWMRFQIVENNFSTSGAGGLTKSSLMNHTNTKSDDSKNEHLKPINDITVEVPTKGASPEAWRQTQLSRNDHQAENPPQSLAVAAPVPNTSVQERSVHHDSQLPEWITTTTTTSTGQKKRKKASSGYQNYGITDSKQQQQHHAMAATLTKAAVAAGAAADADERNRSKKNYRYNTYYNYYNHGNYDVDFNAQRRRRRYSSSSLAPYGLSSHNNKPVIRSAEELYNRGTSRRGGRLQGHHNDPQIHLVFQDYETSARLLRAGTRRGRIEMRPSKETNRDCNYNNDGGNTPPSGGEHLCSRKIRRFARTDRNFIGKPREESKSSSASAPNASSTTYGKSMGLLSQNYVAALLDESTPAVSGSTKQRVDESTV